MAAFLSSIKERVSITGQPLWRPKLIRKKFLIFSILFVVLILAPIVLNQYYNYLLKSRSTQESFQIFIIKPGQPIAQIAKNLEKAGLVKNALAFRLLVAQMGIAKNIQYGDFRLSPNKTSREIAQELTHGAIDVWVTLPEGMRVEQQADLIESKLKVSSNDKYQFDKKEYIKLAQEGYMFPDTYLIAKDAAAKDIVERLRQTFDEKVAKNLLVTSSGLSEDEIVILASLIEKEAKSDEERSTIAGILLNRVDVGMALEVDATVSYAKGYDSANNTWWPTVTVADYKSVKSSYNTYLNTGFPPAPIASPGLESIRSAASPAQTDYFYYLHDSKGQIHYAKTVEEHNKNIQDFL